jgi:hypothetical protein
MSENTVTEYDTVIEGLEEYVPEETTLSLEDIVKELVTEESYSAYKVMKIVNQVFVITGTDKEVPTQMGYNYTRNGMIAKRTKGMSAKDVRYTKDEVTEYVTKYTSKHVQA